MMSDNAQPVTVDAIPVIDITPLRDGSRPQRVASALLKASREVGFIYVAGHGIPRPVIDRARAVADAFFSAPPQEKARYKTSEHHRGWLACGDSRMHDEAAADLKESYIWGYQDEAGHSPTDHPLRGPNVWPDFVPGMPGCAMAYFHHADRVARYLLHGFALGLGLDAGFFLRTCRRPLSRATFVYYPDQPADLGGNVFGVSPHTDFGLLTVLCQDEVGGLQVQHCSGDWIEAPPIENTLVVNVGDLLARWTAGALRSTPHRVVNRSGKRRLSLVLAFDPEPETRVDAAEIPGTERAGRLPPITVGDYLIWRFGRAFAYRQPPDAPAPDAS